MVKKGPNEGVFCCSHLGFLASESGPDLWAFPTGIEPAHPVPESASACLFRLTNVYFELKTKGQCLLKTIKIYRDLSTLLSRLLSNLSSLIHRQELAQRDVLISPNSVALTATSEVKFKPLPNTIIRLIKGPYFPSLCTYEYYSVV